MRHIRFPITVLLVASLVTLVLPTVAQAAIARPASLWLNSVSATAASVRWTSVVGARAYEVRHGTRRVALMRGTSLLVTGLQPATYQQYTVTAIAAGGTRSVATDPLPVVTRASSSCTHFVSTRGSDSARGSESAPWRTLTRLVDAWQPGWVGCVSGAFVEDVSIRRGGAGTSKVTLREWPGSTASLRGRLWIAHGANHVVVSGLRLDGRAIDDNARDSLPSPTVNGDAAMLLGNDISNAGTRVCAVLGSIRGYGSTETTTLAYNRIHGCGTRGSNTHHGIYVESATGTRIVHNVIHDNADRGIQLYPNAQKSLIVGNLIQGNGQGIIFSGAEGYASSGNKVLGNVIAGSELRSNLEHYWEAPSQPGTGNIATRNCLGGAAQGDVALPTSGYVARGNSTGVLRYADAAAGDFRPLASSGCRAWLLSGPLPLRP